MKRVVLNKSGPPIFTNQEKLVIDKYTKIQNIKSEENNNIDHLIFMNDGYVELDSNGYPVDLEQDTFFMTNNKYKNFKYQVNLYLKSLQFADVDRFSQLGTILDIGCGKGGGISFYKDFYKFKNYIGIDLTEININMAKKHTSGIDFYIATATDLPIKDSSVDVITSIESIAYYHPLLSFIKEAARVLKTDGKVIISNHFNKQEEERIEELFLKNNFILNSKVDITKNVSIACAISKFRFLDISISESRMMNFDEQRYLDGSQSTYKSYSFINKN